MSVFVLDASYTLTWCFPDRATANTYETLRRMDEHIDSAVVPWIWQLEVGNAIGKAVVRKKIDLPLALEIWDEPLRLAASPTCRQTQSFGIRYLLYAGRD